MSRPKKFKQGEPITNIAELCEWVFSDGWVYLHGRPKHPTIILNMMLRTLNALLNGGQLFRAHPVEQKEEQCQTSVTE
jgi:hypothetical protein